MTHTFPGLVEGPGFYQTEGVPLWGRIAVRLFMPILRRTVCVPGEECGERMLFFASPRYPPRGPGDEKTKKTVEIGGETLEVAKSTDGVVGGGATSTRVRLCLMRSFTGL
jgi:hypothetical protein